MRRSGIRKTVPVLVRLATSLQVSSGVWLPRF